jgi:hypothetical protein
VPDGLHIDHDHAYGFFAVRGLLRPKCNALMASVDRHQKVDVRASAYLMNAWFLGFVIKRHLDNVAARKAQRKSA